MSQMTWHLLLWKTLILRGLRLALRQQPVSYTHLAMGLLAAVLTCWYVTSVREEAQVRQRETIESYGGDVTRVCVATRDIEPGERIDDGSVAVED